jgi:hypothetical protein
MIEFEFDEKASYLDFSDVPTDAFFVAHGHLYGKVNSVFAIKLSLPGGTPCFDVIRDANTFFSKGTIERIIKPTKIKF